jgi:hypothetical protein
VFCGCTALETVSLPAAAIIEDHAFSNCPALVFLTLRTAFPTLGTDVFYNAGKKPAAGFTIYVPTVQAKANLEAAIADIGSNWHKALKTTDINVGKFNGVEIMLQ